ncbi:MAG TPA: NAD-dependent epimerase/dehydratase family protein, partial [Candidatus Magasanikbacteria bacterium]|nr:NAD-dependent epimerase/dehydratase family protein [Candidatus Magasanikbacteria bacterium]
MKIFVTGGTGFIGSHFIERLKTWNASDAVIYVLVRKETQFNDKRIVPVIGDLHKIEDYREIIQSCDYIFHLAANVNFFGGNVEDDKINFESTKKIVDIVKSNPQKLKNFVFISTIGAVDRHKDDQFSSPLTNASVPAPTTQYGKSKLKSEEYIKLSGLPFTIIRPTWVYGKNMRENSHINKFVSLVYSKSPFHRFNFPGRVSMIYVGDLVGSMVACIDHDKIIGKTYFAGTEAESIGVIFKIIYKEIYSEDLKQVPVPRVFQSITKKVHHKIPLTAANLF